MLTTKKLFQYLIFPHTLIEFGFWGAVIGGALSLIGAKQASDASKSAQAQQGQYMDRQTAVAEKQQNIADEQWQRFLDVYAPLEDQIVAEAQQAPDYAKAEGWATSDVNKAFAQSEAATARAAGRYGLDPSSGRYSDMRRVTELDRAKAEVGARNAARQQEDDKMWARKIAASSLGRGLPATATSTLGQAGQTYGEQAKTYGEQATQYGMQAGNAMGAAGYWAGRAVDSYGDNTGQNVSGISGVDTGSQQDLQLAEQNYGLNY